MRIATYNVEWFNNLFDNEGILLDDDGWSGRWDVTRAQQTEALGGVFTAMDADAIMIIEAPDTSRKRNGDEALDYFAAYCGLRTRKALTGFPNHTQQENTPRLKRRLIASRLLLQLAKHACHCLFQRSY